MLVVNIQEHLYNYMKVNENELPKGAILRYCWSGKKLKNNK